MSALFTPFTLRGVTSRNRIWLAPMCQYSVTAEDGVPTDWHLAHLGTRAAGGFGLVMTEATGVTPEGRISPRDTGLWNDRQTAAWARIVGFVHEQGAAAGVQLAHAGRKGGSSNGSWWFGSRVPAWETIAPSAVVWNGFPAPRAMDVADIEAVVRAFAESARRADQAGFDVVELHGAHGYLLHEFLSPLSNLRTDGYGGSFANRIRFLVEVVDATRAALPDEKALVVRLSATDWIDGGWDVAETVELAALLRDHGVDLVDASSGGLDERQQIPVGPGYQVDFAQEIRAKSGVPTGAVGLLTDPAQAEDVIVTGRADVVSIGRAALREPAWPLRAAHELGLSRFEAPYPPAYAKGAWRPADAPAER
ncbi:NADH:flavin oxidoreductase/NADH oxidase [Pseudonocardia kujensis]|uniref:NADH:flavin oxidoreductase/NADH oxidase n=1 Tax=Pseudonocardia kujensis TaxID=1128675 RepID=UPI001E6329DB|nr:NADH:flavin oxidoreductase/NADH oxidase [Pseudonocardia kujensis]MCE0765057.1 NADH:flavin oxidoreductase/NADH oxidase [Pseudonocardia kujensis]